MLNLSIVLYRSKNFQLFFLISWNGLNTRNFYEYHTKCCKIKVLKYLKRPLRTLKWIIPLRVRDAEVVGSNPVTSTTWQGRRNSWEIKIHLKEILEERDISLNQLSFRAEMQRTQLRNYRDNKIQRLDIDILNRLCYVLECDLNDLIEYIPPETE